MSQSPVLLLGDLFELRQDFFPYRHRKSDSPIGCRGEAINGLRARKGPIAALDTPRQSLAEPRDPGSVLRAITEELLRLIGEFLRTHTSHVLDGQLIELSAGQTMA